MDIKYNITQLKENKTSEIKDHVSVEEPLEMSLKFKKDDKTQLISMPTCGHFIAPLVYVIPMQLLAYHVAVKKKTNIDQPRNLAKSVTVE